LVKPASTLALCAVVAVGLGGPRVRAADEPATQAAITVVVINFAEVPPGILDRAQVEAGRTYRRIGVRTVWLGLAPLDAGTTPDSPVSTPDAGFAIRLIIQSGSAGGGERRSRTVMAAAPPSQSDREGSIYVFYDRVTDVAAMHSADTALLMGIVIAHEMGHVLLRHSGHSAEGLMRGVWNTDDIRRAAIGLLWFSPSELQEIRKTLSTCCPAWPSPVK
jgi:hypothetical protein